MLLSLSLLARVLLALLGLHPLLLSPLLVLAALLLLSPLRLFALLSLRALFVSALLLLLPTLPQLLGSLLALRTELFDLGAALRSRGAVGLSEWCLAIEPAWLDPACRRSFHAPARSLVG